MKASLLSVKKRLLILAGAATLIAVPSGCIAVAAGAGATAVAYIRGELNAPVESTMDNAVRATRAAIADLKFNLVSEKADALSGEFVIRDAQDDRIVIGLKRQTDHITQVTIRVGTFGDEAISQTILESIKKRL